MKVLEISLLELEVMGYFALEETLRTKLINAGFDMDKEITRSDSNGYTKIRFTQKDEEECEK